MYKILLSIIALDEPITFGSVATVTTDSNQYWNVASPDTDKFVVGCRMTSLPDGSNGTIEFTQSYFWFEIIAKLIYNFSAWQ